jgi:hypothetical protein
LGLLQLPSLEPANFEFHKSDTEQRISSDSKGQTTELINSTVLDPDDILPVSSRPDNTEDDAQCAIESGDRKDSDGTALHAGLTIRFSAQDTQARQVFKKRQLLATR